MYFTDRGLEELASGAARRRSRLAWLAERLQEFVDEHPEFEMPVERSPPGSRASRTTTDPCVMLPEPERGGSGHDVAA